MSRLAQLQNLVTKAKQAYYFGGAPIMTDDEYDALEDELRQLAPEDPLLQMAGAPVPADSILEKAAHSIQMGSQFKVNSEEEFRQWYEKSANGGMLHMSLKGDGGSAAAYYEDGKLTQVISRGDGIEGEDITANAAKFKGLPTVIEGGYSGAVRFEVILTKEDWKAIRPDHDVVTNRDGAGNPVNPRNIGNGIMGRKDGTETEALSMFAFDADCESETEGDKIEWLLKHEFQTMPNQMCTTIEEAIQYYNDVVANRDGLPFWIDGVVAKINDLEQQDGLGIRDNRPKGQIAWKFEAEGAETILRSVELTGGHTGAIVPNGRMDPVEIGGTTVQNVLMNNWKIIKELDVAVGDTVYVIKANDIIPKIVEVRHRPADRVEIPEPTECPVCGSEAGRKKTTDGSEGAVTFCLNEDCEKKSSGKIKRWIKSLDIQGIGDSVRDAFIENEFIVDASDLYELHKYHNSTNQLSEMVVSSVKLGKKRAESILAEIDKKRNLTLVQFIGSLGLGHMGKRRTETMATGSDKLRTLAGWRSGDLRNKDVANDAGVPGTADAIQDGVDGAADLIDRLLENGVTVADFEVATEDASAGGKTVCITGTLPSGKKKKDYAEPLAAAGMVLVDKVSKDLDYLVLADPDSSSSKAQKARKFEVDLISEDQLNAMISATV